MYNHPKSKHGQNVMKIWKNNSYDFRKMPRCFIEQNFELLEPGRKEQFDIQNVQLNMVHEIQNCNGNVKLWLEKRIHLYIICLFLCLFGEKYTKVV